MAVGKVVVPTFQFSDTSRCMAVAAMSLLGRVCNYLFQNSVDFNCCGGAAGALRKA